MAATTMHFGPEWMRAKPQTPARQQPPSPPPPAVSTTQQLGTSTYSALVTPATQELGKRDESRPFRYTKEEMLRIYKEGGGRGGLNLEVERWEGIVRDVGNEPAGLREMNEAEKKLFAGPLNSELRRRQSIDPINTLSTPSERQRSSHPASATGSPMRFGPFLGRRRDSTDQPPLTLPRKLSLSNTQSTTSASPREALPSPRNRMGTFGSGFDGVLNGGDSWSRRRPSVGVTGAGGGSVARGEGKEEDSRPSEIKEEEESLGRDLVNAHDGFPNVVEDRPSSPVPDVPALDVIPDDQPPSSGPDLVAQGMAGMILEEQNAPDPIPQNPPTMSPLSSGLPPGLSDPASLEWSYLDPQGQVQGPFHADLMQKWFEEGYFTPDLLVKRTHIDMDWVTVRVLERHAGGGKMFLLQLSFSKGPLGLAIHTDSPQSYSPVHDQSTFSGYQPVPTRTMRTATLDSYLSGPSPSESPSSSLGGGRFGNGSPDAPSFGGRAGGNAYSADPSFGGRAFGGRASFQDSITDPRALNNSGIARAPTIDTFNNYSGGGSPWSAGPGQMSQPFSNHEQHHYSNGFGGIGSGMISAAVPINQPHGVNHERYTDATYSGMGSLTNHQDAPVARQSSDANGMSFNNTMMNGTGGSQFGASGQFPQPSPVPYATPQHHPSVSTFVDTLARVPDPPSAVQSPASAVQPNSASPWTTRAKPFDPPAAAAPARPHVSEWTAPQPAQPVDPSPWLMASLPVVDDVWREIPGPNSLTFSNLGQHNQLHEQEEEGDSSLVSSPIDDFPSHPPSAQIPELDSSHVTSADIIADDEPVVSSVSTKSPAVPKARRKSTARDVQVAAPKAVTASTSASTIVKDLLPAPIPSAPPKPAWAVEEDSKKMSLREIQEAEVKKAEARKAAEREKERIARANAAAAPPVTDEAQPFIASWGLPTSQAGARTLVSPKETSTIGTTPLASNAPVWTNSAPAPTVKKTMKEIQEEEERRKKLAAKESMASAAARRAYAETTVKVVPSAQTSGSAWTTVGSNGKAVPPVSTPARPPVTPAPSINPAPQAVAPRPNGTTPRPAASTAAKVVAPRAEDFPVTPSHDFLKWLSESLKGLNSSVNLEEITSMLLSFPLDPDQSTVEIISDLIYANSTTLDGRRFASEYVGKRKADAASRRGTAGASGSNGKPVSIADVVKMQPKLVQPEWGFKVVNKKKKGGRS